MTGLWIFFQFLQFLDLLWNSLVPPTPYLESWSFMWFPGVHSKAPVAWCCHWFWVTSLRFQGSQKMPFWKKFSSRYCGLRCFIHLTRYKIGTPWCDKKKITSHSLFDPQRTGLLTLCPVPPDLQELCRTDPPHERWAQSSLQVSCPLFCPSYLLSGKFL